MDKIHEMVDRVEKELADLRKFVEEELAPEGEKRTAIFLREVSEKLTEAAGWLEKRQTNRAAETQGKSTR